MEFITTKIWVSNAGYEKAKASNEGNEKNKNYKLGRSGLEVFSIGLGCMGMRYGYGGQI